MNRAFVTSLAALVMGLAPVGATVAVAASTDAPATASMSSATGTDEDDTTRPTVNEFFPEERPLGDCLSSLPKPDCGSEARGGWAQTAVFVAILLGLAFIAWRVVATSRRARRDRTDAGARVSPGTPGATTVPDGDGGDPTS